MNFKHIRTQMIVSTVSVVVIAMLVLSVVSVLSCSNIAENQIQDTMEATLESKVNIIDQQLLKIVSMGQTISSSVSTSYEAIDMTQYEKMLSEVIDDNEMVLGSGLWFEPYVFNKNEKYMGPYVYKNGDKIETTYDYSNAEYDYFTQEYYTLPKETKDVIITNPYFDETSNLIMSSCSIPIMKNDTYIGCVTVDMQLDSLKKMINDVQFGNTGKAILLASDGTFLAGVDDEKIKAAQNIKDSKHVSMSRIGEAFATEENGYVDFIDDNGVEKNGYFGKLNSVDWIIITYMDHAESIKPIQKIEAQLVIISLIAVIFCVAAILIQVQKIAKNISKINEFAGSLALGDFTIDPVNIREKNELGTMGQSLNLMYQNNKEVIQHISDHAIIIDDSSEKLTDASNKLLDDFTQIQNSMNLINEATLNSSAATQQVNASVEEVAASVNVLTQETIDNKHVSTSIKKRAEDLKNNSKNSFDSTNLLSKKYEMQLEVSIQNSAVVESIGEMAMVIAGIAEQINLLSLNASIEAARAGEQGKGFAVVASEIGSLANETANAVERIQETISQVQIAFAKLTKDAEELIKFIKGPVSSDYNSFVEIAIQYGKDAEFFAESSDKISNMTNNISSIMGELTDAIQNIAESAQETSEVSGTVLNSVDNVSGIVTDIDKMSTSQQQIASELDTIVHSFKL